MGLELLFAATVALGAPRMVWAGLLVVGAILIAIAVLIGEPTDPEQTPSGSRVDGGSGAGHIRGVVFGDNATVNINRQASQASPLAERSMVRVSIKDLLNLYREHTQVQAERLVEPYIGGWMRVKGVVNDVVRQDLVEGHYVAIRVEETDEAVLAEFPESAQEQLPRLLRGDSLEVVGRISKITSGWIGLEDCEFVD
jgi:hypothetical protein